MIDFRHIFIKILQNIFIRATSLTLCYSQEGEDVILQRLFPYKYRGFYVDIGAHHPRRFSNTYLLYQSGWRGVNVDAMPGSMIEFRRWRPRDINLEIGVSDHEGTLTYHIFKEPALNTFDFDLAEKYIQEGIPILSTKEVSLIGVNSLLEKFLPQGVTIDILSIDVEGMDGLILESLDYSRYKPKVIICENFNRSMDMLLDSEQYKFLRGLGFTLFSKLFNSCIWVDENKLPLSLKREKM